MSSYHVDSEAVIAATAAARASAGRIQAEVNSLHGQLTGLQESWGGRAASAFQSVIAEWNGTQKRVEENLATINEALSRAGQQYAETEQANARLFAR